MRIENWGRHQRVGFIASIAKHQALVASALIFGLATINALSDVRRLRADHVHHRAGAAIETDVGAVVANFDNLIADDFFVIDDGGGGDFTGDQSNACFDNSLAGHTGLRVLRQDGVEQSVGDLICKLVRMSFRHRLGSENAVFAHNIVLTGSAARRGSGFLKFMNLHTEAVAQG